jgi:hypothetical protein
MRLRKPRRARAPHRINADVGQNDMKIIIVLTVCGLLGNGCCSDHAQQILKCETPVTLTGTMWSAVFPGPPNYEDVTKGDAAERNFFLKLLAPVTVNGDEFDSAVVTNVTEIQIGFEKDEDWNTIDNTGSNDVISVTGVLFHAHTSHHRKEILMDVKK